jgi:hypothetical protein
MCTLPFVSYHELSQRLQVDLKSHSFDIRSLLVCLKALEDEEEVMGGQESQFVKPSDLWVILQTRTSELNEKQDTTKALFTPGIKMCRSRVDDGHVPVYTWSFNPSLLSTFNHFCPDFFEGRVYGRVNVYFF